MKPVAVAEACWAVCVVCLAMCVFPYSPMGAGLLLIVGSCVGFSIGDDDDGDGDGPFDEDCFP